MSHVASNKSLRPKMVTVFVAAFLAGGTAAVGVNRFIDVTRARSKATVECEAIFVALRDLPAGNPVTVWDVKLRDWPKAMVPQAALRPGSFEGIAWPEGHVARLSLREGQPVLRSHLQATVADALPAVTQSVAVARPEPVVETPVAEVTPMAEPTTVAQQPVAAATDSVESPAVAEPATVASPATEERVVVDTAAVASIDATTPSDTPAGQATEQPSAPAQGDVEEAVAASPTQAVPTEAVVSATDRPTPRESTTGEGWPSAAETAAGSEAAMRFLVVPERIAIMADELTAPRKPELPKAPVASVATQPKPPKQTVQPKQPAQPSQQAASSKAITKQSAPKQQAATQSITKQSLPRAQYPDDGSTRTKARSTPASPAIRQQSSQATPSKERPSQRTTSAPTPRVAVEPDPESELADEAARTPSLKSVFPNMAAGLEKIESEMTRIRRERFGSLFRAADDIEGEPDTVDAESGGASGQWFPYLRYR